MRIMREFVTAIFRFFLVVVDLCRFADGIQTKRLSTYLEMMQSKVAGHLDQSATFWHQHHGNRNEPNWHTPIDVLRGAFMRSLDRAIALPKATAVMDGVLESPEALLAQVTSTNHEISSMQCCCGRQECPFLEHNSTALAGVEKDLLSAARIGQVS